MGSKKKKERRGNLLEDIANDTSSAVDKVGLESKNVLTEYYNAVYINPAKRAWKQSGLGKRLGIGPGSEKDDENTPDVGGPKAAPFLSPLDMMLANADARRRQREQAKKKRGFLSTVT